ncbi:MAG: M28 family peptidase, partial [Bellilinea sp.]
VMESAFPSNDRNEIIAQKLLQKLSGMGVKVYEEWVPYQTAEIFDPQQNLMFQLLPYRIEGNPMTLVTSATHFKLASNLLNQKTPLIYSPIDQVIEVCDSLDQRWLMLAGHSREPVHFIHPVVELLEKKCALPMGIVGVALQDPAGISSDVKQVMEKNVEIKFYQAKVLGATIRGSVYPEKEIWVTTHYDAREGTPAADLSLTGTVTLLELARQFAESGTPYTLRFIWLPGLASQYSGLIAYIQNHSTEIPSVVGVIDISQTGNWHYIAVDNDLNSSDINGQGIDIERVKTEGQYVARENWMMSINLDDPNLMDWLNGLLEKKMGLSESPEILRNSILKTGESFGVSIKSTNYTCPLSLSILLSANLPSIGLCGAGNELIGSPFDDISTIDMHKLSQFTSFSYVALQNLMDETK